MTNSVEAFSVLLKGLLLSENEAEIFQEWKFLTFSSSVDFLTQGLKSFNILEDF